jgi:hypothetical protein
MAKEPWWRTATPVTEIDVLPPTTLRGTRLFGMDSEERALRMLLELGFQVPLVDQESDFTAFSAIVAPDKVRLSPEPESTLRAYLAGGGALLLSHESGLCDEGQGFALSDEIGLEYCGPSRHDVEFLRPIGGLESEIPPMDHALYLAGSAVRALPGTQVQAAVVAPYFSRTWDHFSSHAQTPPDPAAVSEFAAVTLRGRLAYVAHPIFGAYRLHGYAVYQQIVAALLRRWLPKPLVRTSLPATGEVSLVRQDAGAFGDSPERLVCHVLHYALQRRTPDLDLLEDVIPLHDVDVAVRTGWIPGAAYVAPERAALDVTMNDDYAHVPIPEVRGHAMIVMERESERVAGPTAARMSL